MNGTSEVRLNFQAQAPAVGGGGDGGGDDREKQFFAQMKAVKGNEAAAKESKRKKELAMMTEEEVRNDGRGGRYCAVFGSWFTSSFCFVRWVLVRWLNARTTTTTAASQCPLPPSPLILTPNQPPPSPCL